MKWYNGSHPTWWMWSFILNRFGWIRPKSGERHAVPWVNREILDQDCERTTLVFDVIVLDVPLGTEMVIEDLEISSTDLDAELLLQEDWEIETLEESWQVDLLGTWIPTMEQAWPRHEDPDFDAMMAELAR